MKKLRIFGMIFLITNLVFGIKAQGQEVRMAIPGKADMTYDGKRIQIESTNTLIGQYVGQELTSGLENTFLGKDAGRKNEDGSQNTYLGMNTGYNNLGSGNVFIGYGAGQDEEGSDRLYISNRNTPTPLIYGEFREGRVRVNDYLFVSKDLTVDRKATITTELNVLGSTSLYSLNINSPIPSLAFFAPSFGSYRFTFHPSQDRFYLEDDDNEEVFEVKNGELTLPQYAGTTGGNLVVDENGKLIKTSANRTVFNVYEFHLKETFSNYTKLTRGVQFEDGTVISGIKALIRDNNTSGSTGVQNTTFVGIYRMDKTIGNSSSILPIYRIDAADTAAGVHEPFTQTTLAQTGANIVDNSTYIYLIQVFYCDDCSITEVEILE